MAGNGPYSIYVYEKYPTDSDFSVWIDPDPPVTTDNPRQPNCILKSLPDGPKLTKNGSMAGEKPEQKYLASIKGSKETIFMNFGKAFTSKEKFLMEEDFISKIKSMCIKSNRYKWPR